MPNFEPSEYILFTRENLYMLLGQFGLPPWSDQRGGYIGAGLDCAVIASEIIAAVEECSTPLFDVFELSQETF